MDEKEKVLTEVGKAPIPYAAFERQMPESERRKLKSMLERM